MSVAATPKSKRAGAGTKSKARLEPVRDAERTQQAILAAAEAEFASKGLAGARVDVIAEQRTSDSLVEALIEHAGHVESP